MTELKEGYYYLTSKVDPEPVLVHFYFNTDADCHGFGFNIHDGGGFLPESHLTKDSTAKMVEVKVKEA